MREEDAVVGARVALLRHVQENVADADSPVAARRQQGIVGESHRGPRLSHLPIPLQAQGRGRRAP
jgi:hypothetical protein